MDFIILVTGYSLIILIYVIALYRLEIEKSEIKKYFENNKIDGYTENKNK